MTGTLSSWKFKLQTIANEYASEHRIYRRPGQQIQTPSRHIEFYKADRTKWKLTLQDIDTTPKELKTERDCSHRQLFQNSSWLTTHLLISVPRLLTHILVIPVPLPGKPISLMICVPLTWKPISLVICVPLALKHISLVICVPPTWETHITRDTTF